MALFHDDHGNLGAVGLTADATGITTLTDRLKAMYAQEEQDSEEGLTLVPKYRARSPRPKTFKTNTAGLQKNRPSELRPMQPKNRGEKWRMK